MTLPQVIVLLNTFHGEYRYNYVIGNKTIHTYIIMKARLTDFWLDTNHNTYEARTHQRIVWLYMYDSRSTGKSSMCAGPPLTLSRKLFEVAPPPQHRWYMVDQDMNVWGDRAALESLTLISKGQEVLNPALCLQG